MKKGYIVYNEKKFNGFEINDIESVFKDDVFEELLSNDYSKSLFISIAVDQIKDFGKAIEVFEKYLRLNIPVVLFNRSVVREENPVTHTGRMIKDNFIFNSLMSKYGVINCYTFEELRFASMILDLGDFEKYASKVQLVNVNNDIKKVVQKEMETVEESDIKITSIDNMGNCIQYGKVTFVVDEMLSLALKDVSESCYGDSMIVPNSRVFFKMLNQCIERMTNSYEFSNMALTINKVFGEIDVLSEIQSRAQLKNSEIRISKNEFAKDLDELLTTADRIGYPVVMKINSLDIPHKSDVGGVVVGVKDRPSLEIAYHKMMDDVTRNCPDALLEGIMISEMAPRGYEIILGAYNHDVYGPVVMVGDGGVTTEIFKDVAYAPVPVSEADANRMVENLRIYPILSGYRGADLLDVERLVKDIMSLSDFMYKNIDTVKEVDINPLFLYEKGNGSCAVDALVVIKKGE